MSVILSFMHGSQAGTKGFTIVEGMITVAIIAIVAAMGPNLITQITRYWRLQVARANVQKNARISLDFSNRHLRQASATSVTLSQRPSQPPHSWVTFTISTGPLIGTYGIFQEGTNLNYAKNGTTNTLATDLKFLAFSYPKTDDATIISVSMAFEEATFTGYSKALQLSIEKVRIMN